jgi:hypothetical protein
LKELPGRLLPPQAENVRTIPQLYLNSLLPTLQNLFRFFLLLVTAHQQIYHTESRFATAFAFFSSPLVSLGSFQARPAALLLSAGFARLVLFESTSRRRRLQAVLFSSLLAATSEE